MFRSSRKRLMAAGATALLMVGLISPAAVAQTPGDQIRDLSAACPSGEVPRGVFNDVGGGTFGLAIDCLSWYDIGQGVGGGSFDQDASVTRGQMALFLHRLLGAAMGDDRPAYDGSSQFNDVADGSSQAAAINVLASSELADILGEQIVGGYGDGNYGPGDTVSREQMGTFVARTIEGLIEYFDLNTSEGGYCIFIDQSDIANTHRENVSYSCSFGVAGGRTDGTFGPRASVTRGQMAAFIMRTVDLFSDVPVNGEPTDLIPPPNAG